MTRLLRRGALPALSILLALLGAAAVLAHSPQPAQQPAQQPAVAGDMVVVEVAFVDQADANRLAGQLDVWEVDHDGLTLVAYVTAEQFSALQAAGYSVRRSEQMAAAAIPNFACYRTVDETYTALAQIAATHPHLAQWLDIGDSWLKKSTNGSQGSDLQVLMLTNRALTAPKPRLFVMAAIHARELVTAETATRFAELLVTRYGQDPQITFLLDYNEIHILAQANPDGRRRAEEAASGPIGNPNLLWRKNVNSGNGCTVSGRYGVDLNRNGSFRWGACQGFGCSSPYACDLTYRGSAAASEPETQAVEAYLRSIFPDHRGPGINDAAPASTQGVMISLHSYSELVLFPWGWTSAPPPNLAGLAALGRKFGYFTGYPACQSGAIGCLYQTDGSSDDFSYGELGVASYTFEMGTAFFQDCATFESDIVSQTLHALTYAAGVAVLPYRQPSGPDVVTATVEPGVVEPGASVTLTVQIDDGRTINSPIFGQEPIQPIANAGYTVDAPPWCGVAGIPAPLKALDGFDGAIEWASAVINTSGWKPGRHTIYVQAGDAAGNQGPVTAVFLDVGGSEVAQVQDCLHRLYLPIWLVDKTEE